MLITNEKIIFKVPKKREPVPVPVALPQEEEVPFEEEIVSEEETLLEEEEILPEEEEVPPEEEEFVPEEEIVPEEVVPEIKPQVPRGITSLLRIITVSFMLNSTFPSFCSSPVLSMSYFVVSNF